MNKKVLLLAVSFSVATLFSCNGQKGQKDVSLKNAADSVSYGIGISIGTNMKKDGLDSLNLDILKAAIQAAIKGDTNLLMTSAESQAAIQSYLGKKQEEKSANNVSAGKKFLEENKKKAGVKELPDGLQYEVITEGTGPMPTADGYCSDPLPWYPD